MKETMLMAGRRVKASFNFQIKSITMVNGRGENKMVMELFLTLMARKSGKEFGRMGSTRGQPKNLTTNQKRKRNN